MSIRSWLSGVVSALAGQKISRGTLTQNDFLASVGMLGAPTRAGVVVGEKTAIALSTLWCGLTCISQDVGTLEPVLYYRDQFGPDGKRKRVPCTHPVARLLEFPNPYKTRPVWWQTFVYHYLLNGQGIAAISRGMNYSPESLWLVHPKNARVLDDPYGRPWWTIQVITSDGRTISPIEDVPYEDMLHVPGLAPDGVVGYKLIEVGRELLGFGLAAQTTGASLFGNGLRIGGVLETAGQLSDPARENLRKSWELLHAGPVNAGKVAILEEGLQFKQLQMTNEQAQTKDLLAYITYEVARLLNIPPAKLHSLEKATWGNLEQLFREYATTTLRPILVKCECELETKLLTPSEQQAMYIEFDTNLLMRADLQTRYTANSTAVGKWKTVNEVRAEENLPPLPGGDTLQSMQPPPAQSAPVETGETDDQADTNEPVEPKTAEDPNDGRDSAK